MAELWEHVTVGQALVLAIGVWGVIQLIELLFARPSWEHCEHCETVDALDEQLERLINLAYDQREHLAVIAGCEPTKAEPVEAEPAELNEAAVR